MNEIKHIVAVRDKNIQCIPQLYSKASARDFITKNGLNWKVKMRDFDRGGYKDDVAVFKHKRLIFVNCFGVGTSNRFDRSPTEARAIYKFFQQIPSEDDRRKHNLAGYIQDYLCKTGTAYQ
jgi:hypothetical protein